MFEIGLSLDTRPIVVAVWQGEAHPSSKRVLYAGQALLIGALVSTDCMTGFQLAAIGVAPGPVEQQHSR